MAKLTLNPSGTVLDIDENTSILERLIQEEIYIRSSCGGTGSCSECMIKIVSGEDYLSPSPFEEIQLLGNVFHLTKERLACQLKITSNVTIDISHHNFDADQKRRDSKNKEFIKSKIRVKKKEQVEVEAVEREEERAEYHKSRDKWKGHWKNENDPNEPKRLGGGKRPKLFTTPEPEELNSEDDSSEDND